jgi:hypothetical protein
MAGHEAHHSPPTNAEVMINKILSVLCHCFPGLSFYLDTGATLPFRTQSFSNN